jgi:glutamine cyclotransferase
MTDVATTSDGGSRAWWGKGVRSIICVLLLGGALSGVVRADVPRLETRILGEHPHDPEAFTQGLLWHDGALYESTGQYGESTLRQVDPETGAVLRQVALADDLFGEGLARIGDRLLQITWREGRALLWSIDRFEPLGEHTYTGHGWGLCHDGTTLFMSDGTQQLTLRDPDTFEITGALSVSLGGRAVRGLNELECAEGWIWANVYGSDTIVRIDPTSGRVTALADASALHPGADREGGEVLNGIAYRPDRGTFIVTGKNWPRTYEVVFVETPSGPGEP